MERSTETLANEYVIVYNQNKTRLKGEIEVVELKWKLSRLCNLIRKGETDESI